MAEFINEGEADDADLDQVAPALTDPSRDSKGPTAATLILGSLMMTVVHLEAAFVRPVNGLRGISKHIYFVSLGCSALALLLDGAAAVADYAEFIPVAFCDWSLRYSASGSGALILFALAGDIFVAASEVTRSRIAALLTLGTITVVGWAVASLAGSRTRSSERSGLPG